MLPTSYVFDSALNLDKCFKNTPPSTLPIDDLHQLPKNWLMELEKQCHKIAPNLRKNFFLRHVGPNSKYKLKAVLLKQLSFIFYKFSGHLHSELSKHQSSQLLLLVLTEDINECTSGFHIRVNQLVNFLQTPDTFEQLLYLVRKKIVQEIAYSLTSSVPPRFQVHVVNRVCRIAKKQDLGIEPNIQKDPYKSLLPGETIRERLQSKFPQHYTPFKIPFLLAEQLQAILNQSGYINAKETGYAIGPVETMLKIIQNFLTNPASLNTNKLQPFFILDKFDEFDEPTRIYDLNWPLIRQLFFQKLIDENYFTKAPKPVNLIEYAYFQTLLPKNTNSEIENQFINDYLESDNYVRLLDDLTFIQANFSEYWQKLIKNSIIIKNIDKFFLFLKNQSQVNAKEQLKRLTLTYTLFFSQTKEYILSKIIYDTGLNLRIINNNLFFKSIRFHPEIIEEFLNIFHKKYSNQSRIFFNLLFTQNNEGSNLLMLAAQYHTKILRNILFLLNKHSETGDKEIILSLFLFQNNEGWNLFSLAAKYQPDAIQYIFDFISKNSHYFYPEILSIIFHQKNNAEWNFLQLLVRYQSEDQINSCLDFISERFEFSKNKKWLEIILNKEHTGHLLRLTTRSSKSALNSILDFMSKHSKQLDFHTLQHCFSDSDNKGWHSLHKAACSNSSNLILILEFIQKHSDQFNSNTLQAFFLAQNQDQENFLLLAVHYQSDAAVGSIFKFLNRQIEFFDKASLQQLFLQQNSNGWNLLSMAYLQPANLKLIFDFINTHPKIFDAETIKKIILQKNKHDYICLHYAVRFQPDSLEVILDFIDQHFALFANELKLLFEKNTSQFQLITTIFRKPTTINLLAFSLKHQQESAVHIARFLKDHPETFDLKKNYLKKLYQPSN